VGPRSGVLFNRGELNLLLHGLALDHYLLYGISENNLGVDPSPRSRSRKGGRVRAHRCDTQFIARFPDPLASGSLVTKADAMRALL
jgi:hypothetical protein